VREVVFAVEGWADTTCAFDSMRGGPFPGKRVYPRERKGEVGRKKGKDCGRGESGQKAECMKNTLRSRKRKKGRQEGRTNERHG